MESEKENILFATRKEVFLPTIGDRRNARQPISRWRVVVGRVNAHAICILTPPPQRFGRETFSEASKISNRSDSTQIDWPRFKYMVFDIPTHRGTYAERYKELGKITSWYHTFVVLFVPSHQRINLGKANGSILR